MARQPRKKSMFSPDAVDELRGDFVAAHLLNQARDAVKETNPSAANAITVAQNRLHPSTRDPEAVEEFRGLVGAEDARLRDNPDRDDDDNDDGDGNR